MRVRESSTDDQTVFALSDRFVEQLAAHQPMLATQMGVAGHDAEWGKHDPESWQDLGALIRSTRSALSQLPPTDRYWERLGRRVLDDYLGLGLERIEREEYLRDLNNIASPPQALRGTFDLMPHASEADWSAIADRLQSIGEAIEGYIDCLALGQQRGLLAARRQVLACLEQCCVHASDGTFFDTLDHLARDSGITPSLQHLVSSGVQAARAAYARLGGYLEGEYLPVCPAKDAVGLERYRFATHSFLLTEIDHEAVYHWGWQEIGKLKQQMETVSNRIWPGRCFKEVVQLLKTDSRYSVDSPESFLERMSEIQQEALQRLDNQVFDVPEQVRTVEVRFAPKGSTLGAYYIQPSEDFSRPGCVWYAKPDGITCFPLYDEVTTAYHEGFPGHHLQIGVQLSLGDQLTRAHRLAIWHDGYGEGWALYAERLMAELGYLGQPEYEFGLLASQMMRACRVVIDIGMHLDLAIPQDASFEPGTEWTFETAVQLLTSHALMDDENSRSEVTRYLGWPGQAISYKVGEQFILDLREEATREDWFTLKEFHRRVLGAGPVGLDHLKELIIGTA